MSVLGERRSGDPGRAARRTQERRCGGPSAGGTTPCSELSLFRIHNRKLSDDGLNNVDVFDDGRFHTNGIHNLFHQWRQIRLFQRYWAVINLCHCCSRLQICRSEIDWNCSLLFTSVYDLLRDRRDDAEGFSRYSFINFVNHEWFW